MITFKVGEASPANTFFAIWMAEAAGLYKQNDLGFEVVKMVGGFRQTKFSSCISACRLLSELIPLDLTSQPLAPSAMSFVVRFSPDLA